MGQQAPPQTATRVRARKVIGLERVAIMAALNIAHEFLSMKVGGSFDIAETKRRIHRMETAIDQAMAEQSKLF